MAEALNQALSRRVVLVGRRIAGRWQIYGISLGGEQR
jgi:hypothetical protein